MRLYNHINEVLKIDPKLIKINSHGKGYIEYESVNYIGKESLDVYIEMLKEDEVSNEWEIAFHISGNYKGGFPDTTIKDTIQILNVLVSAVDDFIKHEKPEKFYFVEATAKSGGIKLYKKFAQYIIKQYPYELSKYSNTFNFKRK